MGSIRAKVRWSTVIQPLTQRGLKVLDLEMQARALLTKLIMWFGSRRQTVEDYIPPQNYRNKISQGWRMVSKPALAHGSQTVGCKTTANNQNLVLSPP